VALPDDELLNRLATALQPRANLFDEAHLSAFRLFNGFYEGFPGLAVDIYAHTLVLHNYAKPPQSAEQPLLEAQEFYLQKFSWLNCVMIKHHRAEDPSARRGELTFGLKPDRQVQEAGVWYALDLLLHQDASLYLDTRNLRLWAQQNLRGAAVLNTFAYSGSLGVAALAGGARRVIQLDRSRAFLNLAKTSYSLNGFPIQRSDFLVGDFFPGIARLKRSGQLFDCVFLDPPIFSVTERGTVDILRENHRLINKVRPLLAHGGWLVAVNNALYLSGKEYMQMLEELAADGYLYIEAMVPIPPDFTGYAQTATSAPPVDPAPFNHPTKIAILRARRKDATGSSSIQEAS
jgi:23S rRNA (cytosine1962-C5)-methyltransferase